MNNGKMKKAIVMLAILLAINMTALAGILIYRAFHRDKTEEIVIKDNYIFSSQKDQGEEKEAESEEETENEKSEKTVESGIPSTPVGPAEITERTVNAVKLSLYQDQSTDNSPFNVSNMFPGDSVEKFYKISVSYEKSVKVRFRVDVRPGYEKLAEVLRCEIATDRNGVLFDGMMKDASSGFETLLSSASETTENVVYTVRVSLDTSVGNEYQEKNLIADFIWWVDEIENLTPPQTGVDSHVVLWGVLSLGSGVLILLLLLAGKRRREEEETN